MVELPRWGLRGVGGGGERLGQAIRGIVKLMHSAKHCRDRGDLNAEAKLAHYPGTLASRSSLLGKVLPKSGVRLR